MGQIGSEGTPAGYVRGGSRKAKNGLCEGSARGNWDPREGQQPF